jgi:hypothetical protein
MKKLIFLATLLPEALFSFSSSAADAHVIKTTMACENIGIFGVMDNYRNEDDDVAIKKYKAYKLHKGDCRIFKPGTRVIFHHVSEYTDGDYGQYTTVRKAGEISSWVIDKCALDGRDPDIARFPGYVVPEKPCE